MFLKQNVTVSCSPEPNYSNCSNPQGVDISACTTSEIWDYTPPRVLTVALKKPYYIAGDEDHEGTCHDTRQDLLESQQNEKTKQKKQQENKKSR